MYKRGKFNNIKTTVNVGGKPYVFDSKLEAKRYKELKLLQEAGLIRDLQLQPSFELIPKFTKNNKIYRKTLYIADFSYFSIADNKVIIEDVKGILTPIYKLKKKLFEYQFKNLEIQEVYK